MDDRIRDSARAVLPFKLTNGQKQSLKEIVDDLQKPRPMNRLLQGDVGAGKTIVALLAALVAMENGLQVAFMAPTEILAEQHFTNIARLLQPSRFRVALLTGSTGSAARREQLAEVQSGAIDLVVGTQALVQEDVAVRELGLVVIDEQHKFGVNQRARSGEGRRRSALSGDDGDADPAHAGPDGLRRPRRLDHATSCRRAASRSRPLRGTPRRSARGSYEHFIRRAARRGPAGVRRLPAGRGVGDARPQGGDGAAPSIWRRGPFTAFRVGLLHGRMDDDDEGPT